MKQAAWKRPRALTAHAPTPVRIVVPFAPGGGSDFIARFMAQRLTESLGSQVIVENKPGAGGVLGIEQGIKSAPDGYTLTLIASSYTVNPSIYKLNFDPVTDITPIIQMSQGPLLVVAHPSLPVKTIKELIALVDRINADVTKSLKLKETAEQLQNDGVAPAGGTPEQFAAQIKKEIGIWRKVAADAGVKAE